MRSSTVTLGVLLLAGFMLVPGAAIGQTRPAGPPVLSDLDVESAMAEWALGQGRKDTWVDGSPYLSMVAAAGGIPWVGTDSGSRTGSRAYVNTDNGVHIALWVDSASNPYPNATTRSNLVTEWDTKIYPNDVAGFGATNNVINLCIHNIDGAWGIGGYYPGNCQGGNSISVDAADWNAWGYEISAHEFQHYIHGDWDWNEDLWVNEGMSDVAILYTYNINQTVGVNGHISGYQQSCDLALKTFNNADHDYGSTFAYFWYLQEHYGGRTTTKNIVTNTANGEFGINNGLSASGQATTFDKIFYDWQVANILDDTVNLGGKYGYQNVNIRCNSIVQNVFPVTGSSSTQDWAARFVSFSGIGDEELKLTTTISSGSAKVFVVAKGVGANTPTVTEMVGGTMTVTDFGLGGKYNPVYLVVAGSTATQFDYTGDLIDRKPPVTTATVDPALPDGTNGWYASKKPTILLSVNEPATLKYHWDSAADQDYTGKLTAMEGDHTIHFHGVDTSGNVELEQSLNIKVDTQAPVTTVTTDPAIPAVSGWFTTPVTVALTPDRPSTTYYHWDSDAETTYTAPLPAAEGVHQLHFRSISAQGHNEAANTQTIKVDTQAPVITVEVVPAEPDGTDGWYVKTPQVTLTADQADTAIQVALDGLPLAPYVGTFSIDDGQHTVHYTATDAAGNTLATKDLAYKVDTRPPTSSAVVDPADPDGLNSWYVSATTVTLAADDTASARLYFAWDVDDTTNLTGEEYTDPVTVIGGAHTLFFWAVDQAGNTETAQTLDLKVDTKAPGATLSVDPAGDLKGWLTGRPKVVLTADENGSAISYQWDGGAEAAYAAPLDPPEGKHKIIYWATDPAGNTGAKQETTLKVDNHPPVAAITATPTSPLVGQQTTFATAGSTDSNGIARTKIEFGDGESTDWLPETPQVQHKYRKHGLVTVKVTVEDVAGQQSSAEITVKVRPAATACVICTQPSDSGTPVPWYQRSVSASVPISIGLLLVIVLIATLAAVGATVARRRKHHGSRLAAYEPEARGMDSPFGAGVATSGGYDDGFGPRGQYSAPSYAPAQGIRAGPPQQVERYRHYAPESDWGNAPAPLAQPAYHQQTDWQPVTTAEPADAGWIEETMPRPVRDPGPVPAAPASRPSPVQPPMARAVPAPAPQQARPPPPRSPSPAAATVPSSPPSAVAAARPPAAALAQPTKPASPLPPSPPATKAPPPADPDADLNAMLSQLENLSR